MDPYILQDLIEKVDDRLVDEQPEDAINLIADAFALDLGRIADERV